MKQPKFVSKPGQVDYTDIRYAPVVNALVENGGELLLVRRSSRLKIYPGQWGTVDGYLDDQKSIEEKVIEELEEEVGVKAKDIIDLQRGTPIIREDPEHSKTWLIIPVLVKVKTKSSASIGNPKTGGGLNCRSCQPKN